MVLTRFLNDSVVDARRASLLSAILREFWQGLGGFALKKLVMTSRVPGDDVSGSGGVRQDPASIQGDLGVDVALLRFFGPSKTELFGNRSCCCTIRSVLIEVNLNGR